MIFHFGVLMFSLLFYAGLAWLSREPIIPSWPWYALSTFAFVVLSLAASRRLTGKWYPAYLPSVVSFSALLLLSLIDVKIEQFIFIIAVTTLYYGSLLGIYRLKLNPEDKTARALLNTTALASLFFSYSATYGLYLNYEVPLGFLMGVFFLVSVIVAFQILFWAGRDDKRQVFLSALVLGALVGELIWVMHFWPFGYLTVGVTVLMFYYVIWRIALDMLRGTFILRQAVTEGIILIILMILLLLSAPWRMRA